MNENNDFCTDIDTEKDGNRHINTEKTTLTFERKENASSKKVSYYISIFLERIQVTLIIVIGREVCTLI